MPISAFNHQIRILIIWRHLGLFVQNSESVDSAFYPLMRMSISFWAE